MALIKTCVSQRFAKFIVYLLILDIYGDIVSFKLMGQRLVILNDVDVVRKAFAQDVFSGRPHNFAIEVLNENMGIVIIFIHF